MTPSPERRMIVVAVDAFKGSVSAPAAADALAAGWQSVHPHDDVRALPQADGGEGTAQILHGALADPGYRAHQVAVTGPDGRTVTATWWALDGQRAVLDLACASGLPLMAAPSALTASTTGTGELIAAAYAAGYRDLTIAVGGSASTDGGAGALGALGLVMTGDDGTPLGAPGGGALTGVAAVDPRGLPTDVTCRVLCDVTAPLLGDRGAARVFGPQKGADDAQIAILEAGLARWVAAWDAARPGPAPSEPGMGAAGGTAFGLVRGLGASLLPGAVQVAAATGLPALAERADVLITGEGRLDASSLTGKVVGHALGLPGPRRRCVVAGQVDPELVRLLPGVELVSLTALAGGTASALADPLRWLTVAGAALARDSSSPGSAPTAPRR